MNRLLEPATRRGQRMTAASYVKAECTNHVGPMPLPVLAWIGGRR